MDDGDVVQIGNMAWKVLLTPGHSKGGMCWYMVPQFGNHADGAPVLVFGDTLFAGTTGRTDFEGGSVEDMQASMIRLALLPDETIRAARPQRPDHHRRGTPPHLRPVGERGIGSPFRQTPHRFILRQRRGRGTRVECVRVLGKAPWVASGPTLQRILRQGSAFRVKRPCSARSLGKSALN